jgi:hypothetical protein
LQRLQAHTALHSHRAADDDKGREERLVEVDQLLALFTNLARKLARWRDDECAHAATR